MLYFKLIKSYIVILYHSFIEYPLNIFGAGIGGILNTLIYLVLVFLIFHKPNILPNYDYYDMQFLLGAYVLYDSLLYLLCKDLFNLNNLILDGGYLEIILTKPINFLFHIILRGFNFGEVLNIIISIGIILTAVFYGNYSFSIINICMAFITTIVGALFCCALIIILASTSFYIPARVNFNFIYGNILEFIRYPTSIYSKTIQKIFLGIFPIAITGYYQLLLLKDRIYTITPLVFAMVSSIIFFVISYAFFKFSIKKYICTGS